MRHGSGGRGGRTKAGEQPFRMLSGRQPRGVKTPDDCDGGGLADAWGARAEEIFFRLALPAWSSLGYQVQLERGSLGSPNERVSFGIGLAGFEVAIFRPDVNTIT